MMVLDEKSGDTKVAVIHPEGVSEFQISRLKSKNISLMVVLEERMESASIAKKDHIVHQWADKITLLCLELACSIIVTNLSVDSKNCSNGDQTVNV